MEKIAKHKTGRKLTDSELNIWVKKLPANLKTIFYKTLFNNKLMWGPERDIYEKQKYFNNYRYKEVAKPGYRFKFLVYLTALAVDAELKISTIFPDIEQEWIEDILPALVESSLKTNHFSYAKNQKEQYHRSIVRT